MILVEAVGWWRLDFFIFACFFFLCVLVVRVCVVLLGFLLYLFCWCLWICMVLVGFGFCLGFLLFGILVWSLGGFVVFVCGVCKVGFVCLCYSVCWLLVSLIGSFSLGWLLDGCLMGVIIGDWFILGGSGGGVCGVCL